MLKNVQEAKFHSTLEPIAKRVLPASSQADLNFESFFTHILAHELSHGIGPHQITVAGRATTLRQELKELYSPIEEAKADVTGLFMLQLLADRKLIPAGPAFERNLYTTFLASTFRTLRFGLKDAHGKGMAMQVNYLTDHGGFVAASTINRFEQVLQIGSPKGVARLLQRAGRSGHAPGAVSRITVVPTHALELVEAAAARRAAEARSIEARTPISCANMAPLDVLTQHLVTCALGGGFRPDTLLAEVRATHAYADLSDEQWQWALNFVVHGGASLRAYPEYQRVVADGEGILRVPDHAIARRHRLNIGTIVSDASITVQLKRGRRLGHVEEAFISRLKPGVSP